MSHLAEDNRMKISNILSHKAKCREIAEAIGCDPTTVSKEVKRSRIVSKEARYKGAPPCPKLGRFPFVCLDCPIKYTTCALAQMRYSSDFAQKKYERLLHESRRGINLTQDEREKLNEALERGLAEKKSVYSIVRGCGVDVSTQTVYRYIAERKVSVSRIDLPYAVTYKKRKKATKKYEYPENRKIDRANRTFIDYLAYKKSHLNKFGSQMDFLGSIKGDAKSILVVIIPELHFPLLFLVENKNAAKVVAVFDSLEDRLSPEKFREVFPSVLTDRDPCFADADGIEFSKGGRREEDAPVLLRRLQKQPKGLGREHKQAA